MPFAGLSGLAGFAGLSGLAGFPGIARGYRSRESGSDGAVVKQDWEP